MRKLAGANVKHVTLTQPYMAQYNLLMSILCSNGSVTFGLEISFVSVVAANNWA